MANEISPCMDCGTDTTPCANRNDCTGGRRCRHTGTGWWEWYMVWPAVWSRAVGPDARGYLCIPCLERRLGRPLTGDDFTTAAVNRPGRWDSRRLIAARER
jgi:hypothetical protein